MLSACAAHTIPELPDTSMPNEESIIAAKSGVMRDIEPDATVGGFPAIAIKNWHRQTAGLARLFQRRGENKS